MKLPKLEFKKLQQHWYEILYLSGFRDIEQIRDDEYVIINPDSSHHRFRNTTPFKVQHDALYFTILSQHINNEKTIFRNEIDRYILTRHSEGAKIKTIVEELVSRGTSRERTTIRITIRKYEMAWGIRSYTDKQLKK